MIAGKEKTSTGVATATSKTVTGLNYNSSIQNAIELMAFICGQLEFDHWMG
jgi:hypothetical protein